MQGPDKRAIVVRGPEGLVRKVEPIKKKTGFLTLPFIRGVVNFGSSMVNGVKALMYSADFFPEEASEPSKFEKWLEQKIGSEKIEKVVVYLSVVLGHCAIGRAFHFASDAARRLYSGAEGARGAAQPC